MYADIIFPIFIKSIEMKKINLENFPLCTFIFIMSFETCNFETIQGHVLFIPWKVAKVKKKNANLQSIVNCLITGLKETLEVWKQG